VDEGVREEARVSNRQQREEDRRQVEREKAKAEADAGNVVNVNEARKKKKAA